MPADREYRLRLDVEVQLASRLMRVDFETESTAIAIVGPSGVGKSTILRVLAGVERRAKGVVEVKGRKWQDTSDGSWVAPWEREVGWVPQEVLLFPHLSVRENLGYGGASAVWGSATAALLQIGELRDRRPGRLSGGELQRGALGRALLSKPRLLLLDEPFSALDRPLRVELARVVGEWASERGVPLVLVSHDEWDAQALATERWHLSEEGLSRD